MFLRQVFDPHLAQYAYVIGCQKTGEAIVIDPLRDVEQYRAVAAAEGLRLTAVAETHIHADFVSGARELAMGGGVQVYVSAEGGPDWQSEWAGELPVPARLLRDGDSFRVGNIRLQALHTPGHTPEHLCYLVTDEGGGAAEPMALVTGDFLFVGDVGRPDLLEQAAGVAGAQAAGAAQLYDSLRRLRDFPDFLQVLPGHGAGSACGKSLGAVPVSTLGYERRYNYALRLALEDSREAFVEFILSGQPEPPLYFAEMKRVNRTGPALIGEWTPPPALDPAAVRARLDDPATVVLDARADRAEFAARHLRGSLYAPSRGDFSGFAGSVMLPQEQIVLVAGDAVEAAELARQLRRIGFDHVLGWIPATAVAAAPDPDTASLRAVKFSDVPAVLVANPGASVLDVRRASEFSAGHLPGAINIAHTRLRKRLADLPPPPSPLVVHCGSGMRAAAASALLQRAGHRVIYVNDSYPK